MRWTVGAGDGATIREVLTRARADAAALREGRVFVGRRRVRSDRERVAVGDLVTVAPPRASADALGSVTVLAHRDDLVGVVKPAGIPTIPDHSGAAHSLLAVVAQMLGVATARLHPTSRLDRDVSGVVIFALTNEAGERLRRARAEGRYERRYVALAQRAPAPERGTWTAPIGRGRDPKLREAGGRDPIPATTLFAVVGVAPIGTCMLALSPVTGRTHQIRVHAAHAGAPLLGDRTYGGPSRLTLASGRVLEPRRIALHAARVIVPLANGAPMILSAPVPPELSSLWSDLGGEEATWDVSLTCDLPAVA